MAKFIKKAITVEAVQLRQDTVVEVINFVNAGRLIDGDPQMSVAVGKLELHIPTPEGVMKADENDWIVKGIRGEFYPVKPDIFSDTYTRAE